MSQFAYTDKYFAVTNFQKLKLHFKLKKTPLLSGGVSNFSSELNNKHK